MFKPLFDEHGQYNNDGNDLDLEVMRALAPFFNRGYSPREVLTIIVSAAVGEQCGAMLTLGMERRKRDENSALNAEQLTED